MIEGSKTDVQRNYSPLTPILAFRPGDIVTLDASGMPVLLRSLGIGTQNRRNLMAGASSYWQGQKLLSASNSFGASASQLRVTPPVGQVDAVIPIGQMMLEAQESAVVAQAQMNNDVRTIEATNAPIHDRNARCLAVLNPISGQDLGPDREAWQRWQADLFGYALGYQRASEPKPVAIQDVPLAYQPLPLTIGVTVGPVTGRIHQACFAAGTPVQTLEGARPIESLLAGDQVLTQDIRTGLLSYQPIVASFHNPPNQTLKLKIGDETIVATPIHRFWRAGQGWVMARDLVVGDNLRVLGGVAPVSAIEEDKVQPVFNLRVAENDSFFVGVSGSLVHDNSLAEPVTGPFDAVPSVTPAPARH